VFNVAGKGQEEKKAKIIWDQLNRLFLFNHLGFFFAENEMGRRRGRAV